MLLIPAIDMKDGRCVRLRQGRMDDETVFGDDPVEVIVTRRDDEVTGRHGRIVLQRVPMRKCEK